MRSLVCRQRTYRELTLVGGIIKGRVKVKLFPVFELYFKNWGISWKVPPIRDFYFQLRLFLSVDVHRLLRN